jgi:two-component system, OmpR family, alkaline phosphatase synthesis response regulator PhoP
MKILIIDDAQEMRFLAGISLSALGGMEVVTASNGREGLLMAESELPDCILLDILMPDIDGLMTLEELRANARTAPIPVIFLTGKGVDLETRTLENTSAIGIITKPFDPASLPSQVRALLER